MEDYFSQSTSFAACLTTMLYCFAFVLGPLYLLPENKEKCEFTNETIFNCSHNDVIVVEKEKEHDNITNYS